MRKTIASIVCVFMLAFVACTTNQLVDTIDILAIAAETAAPFAGAYGEYVDSAAQLAQFAATEASSSDTGVVMAQKILTQATSEALQTPDLKNASAQTQAKILAISTAVNSIITICHQMITPSSGGGGMSFMASHKQLKLHFSKKDSKRLNDILTRMERVRKALADSYKNKS